jgi:hypothetical protein
MTSTMRRSGVALLSLAACAVLSSTALGQVRYRNPPINTSTVYVNPNPVVGPNGLTLSQYAYNTVVLGRVYGSFYRNIPPYALGYNPYPSPVYTSGSPAYYPSTYNPYAGGSILATNPYAANGSVLATNPYGTGYDSTMATNGYGYGNPYVPYYDPYGGTLRGLADVTTANGGYLIAEQRARLASDQVTQSRIDTRRKLFDELRYERMNTPTAEELRLHDIEVSLNRARHDPPLGEIFSARSLNDLYNHLAAQQGRVGPNGPKGPDIRLDTDGGELLKHINLTGGTGGNAGLLKAGGKLTWPVPLMDAVYDDQRKILDGSIEKAVDTLKYNPAVEPALLVKINDALKEMHRLLDANIARMSPSEYMESARYLNMLDDAYKALKDPNASNYITQKWSAKGRTVADLIEFMRANGLKFAPATPGDEPYYRALHHALTAYDAGFVVPVANK